MIEPEYWGTLKEPLKPSASDVKFFADNIFGKVALLGCTKELMPLCEVAIDADPYYYDVKIVIDDWLNYTMHTDCVIADGSFNILTEEDCNKIITMAKANRGKLIVRFFNSRLQSMKVAFNFCANESFVVPPDCCYEYGDYRFLVWNFRE